MRTATNNPSQSTWYLQWAFWLNLTPPANVRPSPARLADLSDCWRVFWRSLSARTNFRAFAFQNQWLAAGLGAPVSKWWSVVLNFFCHMRTVTFVTCAQWNLSHAHSDKNGVEEYRHHCNLLSDETKNFKHLLPYKLATNSDTKWKTTKITTSVANNKAIPCRPLHWSWQARWRTQGWRRRWSGSPLRRSKVWWLRRNSLGSPQKRSHPKPEWQSHGIRLRHASQKSGKTHSREVSETIDIEKSILYVCLLHYLACQKVKCIEKNELNPRN